MNTYLNIADLIKKHNCKSLEEFKSYFPKIYDQIQNPIYAPIINSPFGFVINNFDNLEGVTNHGR